MNSLPAVNMAATGKRIELLRKSAGISVRQLQEIFGFGTPQAVYKWQRGDALPTVDNLVILAAVLGVKIDEILVLSQE
ncbi:MAG: helix-turn-helix transcriptional regulator [Oscillospiraceae bacterium]|nr:helix-turn-helix transcriptional regulator [Oscillospiraceae bacterium]